MRTVLLVEDEPIIRFSIAEDLRDNGFAVIEARTADDARNLFEAHPGISSVVTDVRMPGQMDGLDLARLVEAERPDVRIVIISTYWPAERAPPASATILVKPFETGVIVRLLSEA